MSEHQRDVEWRPERGEPHALIQWKGSEICMDVRCECGAFGHLDASHTYYVRCAHCGRTYKVNPHVQLVEVQKEDEEAVAEMHRMPEPREFADPEIPGSDDA